MLNLAKVQEILKNEKMRTLITLQTMLYIPPFDLKGSYHFPNSHRILLIKFTHVLNSRGHG